MAKAGGSVLGLIIVIFALISFPLLITAFSDIGRTSVSSTATVSTGPGDTSANITLHSGLYADNPDNVLAVTSSNTADEPAAADYFPGNRALSVTGLAEDASRTLTVEYYTAREVAMVGTLLPVTPVLIFVCLLFTGVGIMWRTWR